MSSMKSIAHIRLVLGLCFVACLAASAHAKPDFWEMYKNYYNLKSGTKLGDASCTNCHTSPPRRNPYGKAIEEAMEAASSNRLTTAILDSVASQDSDGDGASNGDEIKANTMPGDPADKPVGGTTTKPSSGGGSGGPGAGGAIAIETPEIKETELIPDHGFHPMIVHFPIALFLFGVFLEFLGKRRNDPGMRDFAVWNLGFGAISGVVSVVTGLVAFLKKGFPFFSGGAFLHLCIGVAAMLLMIVVTLWRRKQTADSIAYWVTLAITSAAIIVGGHLGAMLVYG